MCPDEADEERGPAATLRPPDLPRDDPGAVLLSERMLVLEGRVGRNESRLGRRSWCLSPLLLPPPPIMRLRKPLFLGLIALGVCPPFGEPVTMALGDCTPRRLESDSFVDERVRGSRKRDAVRSTTVSSGGVDAALRCAAAERSLSRCRASSSEMRRCPANPPVGLAVHDAGGAGDAPGTCGKYDPAAEDAGDVPRAWRAIGVEGEGLVEGALPGDVRRLAFESDAVKARACAKRLTVGGADMGGTAQLGEGRGAVEDRSSETTTEAGVRATLGTRPAEPVRVVDGRAVARPA